LERAAPLVALNMVEKLLLYVPSLRTAEMNPARIETRVKKMAVPYDAQSKTAEYTYPLRYGVSVTGMAAGAYREV